MSKKVKELELNDLRKTFKGVRDFVLLQPLKLDSAADYELRKGLRAKKIRVKMVKNTLVKKVFDESQKVVDAILKPEQAKRLGQIDLQVEGIDALQRKAELQVSEYEALDRHYQAALNLITAPETKRAFAMACKPNGHGAFLRPSRYCRIRSRRSACVGGLP